MTRARKLTVPRRMAVLRAVPDAPGACWGCDHRDPNEDVPPDANVVVGDRTDSVEVTLCATCVADLRDLLDAFLETNPRPDRLERPR